MARTGRKKKGGGKSSSRSRSQSSKPHRGILKRSSTPSSRKPIAIVRVASRKPARTRTPAPAAAARIAAREAADNEACATNWVASLQNPFTFLPRALGTPEGSLTFTNTLTADYTIGAGGCSANSIIPRAANSVLHTEDITTSAAGTWATSPMNGDTALATYGQGRILALGIRWTIRTNETQTPGFVSAGNMSAPATTTVLTGATANQISNFATFRTFNGKDAYEGLVSWRPVDGQDGQFDATMTTGSSTYISTNIPVVVFSSWPSGVAVRVEYIAHIEVLPSYNQYLGIPASLNYTSHSYDAILDVLMDIGRVAMASAAVVGKAAVTRYLSGRVLGSLGGGGGARAAASSGPGIHRHIIDQPGIPAGVSAQQAQAAAEHYAAHSRPGTIDEPFHQGHWYDLLLGGIDGRDELLDKPAVECLSKREEQRRSNPAQMAARLQQLENTIAAQDLAPGHIARAPLMLAAEEAGLNRNQQDVLEQMPLSRATMADLVAWITGGMPSSLPSGPAGGIVRTLQVLAVATRPPTPPSASPSGSLAAVVGGLMRDGRSSGRSASAK